jgi:transaldolase
MSADVLFLDSADLGDVAAAAASGIVAGVTTNPTLLHAAADGRDALEHLAAVLREFPAGPVFFQLHARGEGAAIRQATAVVDRLGEEADRVVFKLPAQAGYFAVGARLQAENRQVAMTAVYTPGQVLAAAQCGATWVIPYVDRARRLRPDAGDLVPALAAVAAGRVRVLAASVKSPEQLVQAIVSGVDAVTAPWPLLQALMRDELTDSAVEAFHAAVPS